MPPPGFIPLSRTVADWPTHIFGRPDFLNEIGLQDFRINEGENLFVVSGTLLWFRELSFDLPLLRGFSIALLSEGDHTAVPFQVDVLPGFALSFPNLSAAFRMDTSLLRPVRRENGRWVRVRDAHGNARPAELRFDGVGLRLDLEGNIEVLMPSGAPRVGLGAVELGETGFILEIDGVAPYFSTNQTPPGGAPAGFRGIAIESVRLHLPNRIDVPLVPTDLVFEHLLIGTGGFSGTIRGTWSPTFNESSRRYAGRGAGTLFGIAFALRSLGLTFSQNVPTESSIRGEIVLPFFNRPLGVDIGIANDGDFTVAISAVQPSGATRSPSGLVTLRNEGLELTVESLGFQVQDGVFTAKVSGGVKPLVGGFDWPTFQVRELAIDSDGNVRLEGGWLNLRQQYTLNLHGFRIEISRLGFGQTEDGGKWIGFSGALRLVDGVRAGASVEGLRITWYDDNRRPPQVTLNGVGVEFEVPNVLRFQGAISYEAARRRFTGNITLHLISLNLRANAVLVFGTEDGAQGPYTYMGIYLGVDLPAGIPLWSTGLALYGMAGLFALHMEPDKRADEEWYNIGGTNSYFHRPTIGVTDLVRKWTDREGSLALGAGVTVGTLADNGYTFSGRLLLAIVFPGPIIMIEGRASLLAQRSRLDEEPNFRALAVLDNRAGTFLIGLDAQYKYDREGRLINVRGGAEAFFDFTDASAWHVYVGEREPPEKRIRARLFSLFDASAYVMLDAQQLALGARIGYEGRWSFGPLTATLEAWIEGNAIVSWSPAHFHGDLALHARFELRIFGIGFTLGADASVAADIFDPYHVLIHLALEIRLFWPIPTLRPELTLEWGPLPVPPPLPLPLKEIAVEHFKVTTSWPLPRGTLLLPNYDRGEGLLVDLPPAYDSNAEPPAGAPVVPLDCRPHLTFAHPVHDDAMVGINPQPPDPDRERIGDPARNEGPLLVRYGLQEVALEKWDGSAGRWNLVARKAAEPHPPPTPGWRVIPNPPGVRPLFGSWAPVPATPDGGGQAVAQVKLCLWSKTPFDYTRHTERAWDEWFTDRFTGYPCIPFPADREICCDFQSLENQQQLSSPWRCPDHPSLSVSWSGPSLLPITLVDKPAEGLTQALCFPDGESGLRPELTILLPEPARAVRIIVRDEQGVEAWGVNARGNAYGPFFGGNRGNPVLEVRGEDLVRVVIRGVSRTCLFRVCAVVGPDPSEAVRREEMLRHLSDETARWRQEGEVLEPHTAYRLRVVTTVQAQGEAELAGWSRDATQTEYAYFRTEGPPGLASLSRPAGQPEGEAFDSGLNDLTPYVRQTVPATVPAKGEQPPHPRPVYRAYDVGVEFNEDYVELMYRLERRDLGLYLYDNNNRPVRDAQGRLVSLTNQWGRSEELTLTESERRWVRVVNASACTSLGAWERPRAVTLDTQASRLVLEADTVYEARLVPLLLHEDFRTYEVGSVIVGPAGTAGGWSVRDEGDFAGPSRWEIGEEPTAPGREGLPRSRFIVQTTDIWDGTLDGADPVKPGTMLLCGEPGWTDYRLTAYLRSMADNDALGVVFRYQDANNYYRFSMDREREYRRLVRVAGGAQTILAEDDFVYLLNRDYQITAEALGPSLRVFQDGVLIFDVTDTSITSGQVGLYCWGNPGSRFGEVLVDDLRPQAPVVYHFRFTTSKFANFFHHLHSFQDETWRAAPTAATLPDAIFSGLAGRAVALPTARSEDEARAYEELSALVLAEAARQTPPEVQATWVERDDEKVALLVRSPEPIDWRRTSVSLWRAPTPLPRPEPPAGVKLTDVTFGVSRPNEESVALLLREPTTLTGHRIELRQLPGALAESGDGSPLVSGESEGSSAAAAETAGVLWQSTFADLSEVEIVDEPRTIGGPSRWVAADGELRQLSNIYGRNRRASREHYPGTYALAGGSDWRDVEISLELRSDDNDAIGIMFRYQDGDNYYRFSMDRERRYRRLIKKVGGSVSILWQDGEPFKVGQKYVVVLRAVGGELRASLDGVLLFTVYDNDLTRGRIGFYCWANRGARFEHVEVRRPPREAGALLRDHFSAGHLHGWRVWDEGDIDRPSDWRIVGGALRQLSNIYASPDDRATLSKLGTQMLAGDPAWADVVFSSRLQSSGGAIGLLFRYGDANNYYRFSMDREHGYRRLVKNVGGTFTALWEDDAVYEAGRNYEFTVAASGDRLLGYLDGVRMFAVEDGALAAGQIGLYCWKNASAQFSQVRVFPADVMFDDWLLDEPFDVLSPARWMFVDEGDGEGPSHWEVSGGELRQTSRVHGGDVGPSVPDKPGTYALAGDAAWADYRVITRLRADVSDGAIGVMFRYQDAGNYYRFSIDGAGRCRRLIKKVDGAVTVLWGDAVAYETGREYVLTLDCVGERLTGYLDGVRLFSLADGDIIAGRIGLYCWAQPGARFAEVQVAEPVWSNYCTFGPEARLPAGTRVRVYAGNRADAPPPPQAGVARRFISSLGERGRLRLPPAGAELRLRAPGDTDGHRRRFVHDVTYAAESIMLQRKADGTGFFIFRPSLARFEVGQYRLTMTYLRDNRDAEPEGQVFSEAGDKGPEQVTLDISWQAHQ